MSSRDPEFFQGIILADEHGRAIDLSPKAADILGVVREKFLGADLLGLGLTCNHPEHGEDPRLGRCDHRRLKTLMVNGKETKFIVSCRCLGPNETGKCRLYLLDVSNESDLAHRIFLAKHEVEELLDSIPNPSAVIDGDEKFVRINRALAKLLEKPFDEILKRPFADFAHELGGEEVLGELKRVLKGEIREFETRVGDRYVFKVLLHPMYRAENDICATLTYVDVTEQRRYERKALHDDRLRLIGQLSAGVVHELMTPVGYLTWNMEHLARSFGNFREFNGELSSLLARGDGALADELRGLMEKYEIGEELSEGAEVIAETLDGVESIKHTLKSLRSFSHPGDRQVATVNVEDPLEHALVLAKGKLTDRVEVFKEYASGVLVEGDPQKLLQVFTNIIINGLDAMSGEGSFRIATFKVGDWAIVEIADSGPGIPPEHIDKIFESFFTTKTAEAGTGLGLWLSKTNIKSMGGDISVTSTPGQGAKFVVRMPLKV